MSRASRDIIGIVLDGSRADPSPHPYRALDSLRTPEQDAVVFSHCYTSAVSTGMSWLATLTSQPVHFYARDHASAELLRSPNPIFPSILAEAGYQNTFFIGHHETRRKFVNYFDTSFFDRLLGQSPDEGIRCNTNDSDVLAAFCDYVVQRDPAVPIFSIIHLIQPLHYEMHYQALREFLSEQGLLRDSGSQTSAKPDLDPDARAIVVTGGDHGMDQLRADGSILRHDSILTQPNLITVARIEGGGLPGRVVDTPVLLMDIPPTLLELAGVEGRIDSFHAQSLNPLIFRGRSGLAARERILRVDNRYHDQLLSKTALVRGGWKLVVDNQRGEQQLFRLSDDRYGERAVDHKAFPTVLGEFRE